MHEIRAYESEDVGIGFSEGCCVSESVSVRFGMRSQASRWWLGFLI